MDAIRLGAPAPAEEERTFVLFFRLIVFLKAIWADERRTPQVHLFSLFPCKQRSCGALRQPSHFGIEVALAKCVIVIFHTRQLSAIFYNNIKSHHLSMIFQ